METTQQTKLEIGKEYTIGKESYRYLEQNEKENTHTFAHYVLERTGVERVVFRDRNIESVEGKQLTVNDCGYHLLVFWESTDERDRNEFSRLAKLLQEAEK
jgi:hypothetical protein